MVPYNSNIAPCTDSVQSMGLVTMWLKECREKHSECMEVFSKVLFVPSRLIEFWGATDAHMKVRLREKRQILGNSRYATLSHCWGSAVPFKLSSDNKDALLEGIPFPALSKVFKDAIVVA